MPNHRTLNPISAASVWFLQKMSKGSANLAVQPSLCQATAQSNFRCHVRSCQGGVCSWYEQTTWPPPSGASRIRYKELRSAFESISSSTNSPVPAEPATWPSRPYGEQSTTRPPRALDAGQHASTASPLATGSSVANNARPWPMNWCSLKAKARPPSSRINSPPRIKMSRSRCSQISGSTSLSSDNRAPGNGVESRQRRSGRTRRENASRRVSAVPLDSPVLSR